MMGKMSNKNVRKKENIENKAFQGLAVIVSFIEGEVRWPIQRRKTSGNN